MSTYQDATAACRNLGRQIRGLREDRGLSDRDLVIEAGVLPSTVVAIENGWDGVTIGTVARLVNALGCELSISPRGATLTPIATRSAKQEEHERSEVPSWRPRTWRYGDPMPADAKRVQDSQGDVWTYDDQNGLWYSPDTAPFDWEYIARKWSPLTEVS